MWLLSISLGKRGLLLNCIQHMSAHHENHSVLTVPSGVGSAVGVAGNNWYIAIVKNNTEKSVCDRLVKAGYECYVPLQNETRVWKNGRRASVERVVIPSIVFICCSETERKNIVGFPFILRFMPDRAGSEAGGGKPLATVPDSQIRKLMFMVGNSDTRVEFSSMPYKKGELVRVIRGKLAGLAGEVKTVDDKHSEVIVSLDFLGNARLTIDTADIERISN